MKGRVTTLKWKINALDLQHGGLRKAARAIKVDPAYLSDLRSGKSSNPSTITLTRLGLKRITYYEET